jgi:hypothetical protein
MRNAFNTLVGESERIKPLGRTRRRCEDNIRLYLRKIGRKIVDWMHLAQDRGQWWAVVIKIVDLRVPYKRGIS